MNGDFSRLPFRPSNRYSSVRMQQGRVHLDADWNEQVDIQLHRDRLTTLDTVGRTGAPLDAAGLGVIDLVGGDAETAPTFSLSPGRFYVEGIPVEVEAVVPVTAQPDRPALSTLGDLTIDLRTTTDTPTRYLVYVDVWQRHLSALEAPNLLEVALGVDTTTRTKTIWQVGLAAIDPDFTCANFGADWATNFRASTGRLRPQLETTTEPESECLIPPRGGYRRLENQFYRVELQSGSAAATPQFKWSRDNGAIASELKDIRGNIVVIGDPGRDDIIGFGSAKWVELLDEERLLNGQPGILVELNGVQGTALTVKAWPPGTPPTMANFTTHPIVRRWDGVGNVIPGAPITLEGGLQVEFEAGQTYHAGDYWQVAARSLTGELLWPQTGGTFDYELPHGTHHHYAALALLIWTGAEWTVSDCRTLFPPLTGLIRLFYVSGDGQEAMPGNPLPRPLQVAVSNGKFPIQGARVRFRIISGSGYLSSTSGSDSEQTVLTDEQGIAACSWSLGDPGDGNGGGYDDGGGYDGDSTDTPVVEAVLLEAGDLVIHPPIRFNANFSVASNVAYDPSNCSRLQQASASTVQQAIDALCRSQGGGCTVTVGEGGQYSNLESALDDLYYSLGQNHLCLCLLPGRHELYGLEFNDPNNLRVHLKISGCGAASELVLGERGVILQNLASLTLANLRVDARDVQSRSAIQCDSCIEITIDNCQFFHATTVEESILQIAQSAHILLNNNRFEAYRKESLSIIAPVFLDDDFQVFQSFYPEYEGTLRSVSETLATNPRSRERLMERIKNLPTSETGNDFQYLYQDFISLFDSRDPSAESIFFALQKIPKKVSLASMGVAITILDASAHTKIINNEIIGILSLYGYTDGYGYGYFDYKGNNENDLSWQLYSLANAVKDGRVTFTGGNTLQVQGNCLDRILISEKLLETLIENRERYQIENVYSTISFVDNIIEAQKNQWVGEQITFSGNSFRDLSGDTDGSFGAAIAQSILIIGNHGPSAGPNANYSMDYVAQYGEAAANLRIRVSSRG